MTVVGGVVVSTFLTLFVIPCTYILFDDATEAINRFKARRKGTGTPLRDPLVQDEDVMMAEEPESAGRLK